MAELSNEEKLAVLNSVVYSGNDPFIYDSEKGTLNGKRTSLDEAWKELESSELITLYRPSDEVLATIDKMGNDYEIGSSPLTEEQEHDEFLTHIGDAHEIGSSAVKSATTEAPPTSTVNEKELSREEEARLAAQAEALQEARRKAEEVREYCSTVWAGSPDPVHVTEAQSQAIAKCIAVSEGKPR